MTRPEMTFTNKLRKSCLVSRETKRVLKENFELTRDVCLLNNVLVSITPERHFVIS